jgi:protein SCO1/2
MPQNPIVRAVAFVALLLVVVVVVLAYTPWGRRLWQAPVESAAGPAAIGGPFTLIDQDGKPRTDADFRGRYMLVFFGYTNCPDVCPTTLQTLTDAMAKLGPKAVKVTPIFITVDPARDTPAVMKNYIGAFEGADIVGLTGTPEQVNAAETAYRVQARRHDGKDGDYTMSHASTIVIMDPEGRFVARVPPENIAGRLAQLVR